MTDSKLVSRGKAVGGKVWNQVSSKVGDVYQAAAKASPVPSSSGRTYRGMDDLLATTKMRNTVASRPMSTKDVMGGSALRKREKDAGL